MPRPFTPPDDIKAKARTVLRQLDGLSLADARYVLDVAQSTLSQEVDSTLAREVFRTPIFQTPTQV